MRISEKHTNIALLAAAAVMGILCAASILETQRPTGERTEREHVVIERLSAIRKAEAHYLKTHGHYCGTTDSLAINGLIPDSLTVIPYSGGKKFDIKTSVVMLKSGKTVPVMQCGAEYTDYMRGMDPQTIADAIQQATDEGRYPGLKFGSLNTPDDNSGNWE